jgi:hypothetical protein
MDVVPGRIGAHPYKPAVWFGCHTLHAGYTVGVLAVEDVEETRTGCLQTLLHGVAEELERARQSLVKHEAHGLAHGPVIGGG